MDPQITVLMAVYNGAKHLHESIDSILSQTMGNFEFVIVDDCSQDNTWEILKSYRDPRIHLVRNQTNIGLTRSLNIGLNLARAEFVARIDADDLAYPARLDQQLSFLIKNRKVGMAGSWFEIIDESDNVIEVRKLLTESHLLRWRLCFKNHFCHSAVMFRKAAVLESGGYDGSIPFTQDYDLWFRLGLNWEIVNIPEILTKWRKSKNSITALKSNEQTKIGDTLSERNLAFISGGPLDGKRRDSLLSLYGKATGPFNASDLAETMMDVETLLEKFMAVYGYDTPRISIDLRNEIFTHLFTLIWEHTFGRINKVHMMLHVVRKIKPRLIRVFFGHILKRTLTGIEVYKKLNRGYLSYS